MSEQRPRVVAVGEALIEFVRGGTAVSASAAPAIASTWRSISPAPASTLRLRPRSGMIPIRTRSWRSPPRRASPATSFCARGRLPGLTVVDADTAGTRRRYDWGADAPARDLFELPDWGRVAEGLTKAKLVYFSGITLSLYSNTGLGRFLALIEMVRQQGVKVAFDGNFRPRGWRGDLSRTRAVFMEALKRIDMALPAYDDEAVLWGDPSPDATVERLQAFGIAEIVVKNGPNSALVASGGRNEFIPVPEVVVPVDTTAAGDSFNAAYIAARMAGKGPAEAAVAAHRLAAQVIRHRGALMPRAAAAVH